MGFRNLRRFDSAIRRGNHGNQRRPSWEIEMVGDARGQPGKVTRTLLALLVGLLPACHMLPRTVAEHPVPDAARASVIARGLEYLAHTQITRAEEQAIGRNWAGNWPMAVRPEVPFGSIPVVEIAAGLPAYVHTSLCVIHEGTQAAFGLEDVDITRARAMRRRIWPFLERFRSPGPDPTSYGWWPRRNMENRGLAVPLAALLEAQMKGPRFHGDRGPVNIPAFPASLGLFPDTDDTALVLAARVDAARLDGRPPITRPIAGLFHPWRDLAGTPRRFPPWLETGSGAFLTWMMPPGDGRAGNDIDAAINANILWALARYGELDGAGARDAIRLIERVTREGRYRDEAELSTWYPRLFFHFTVARAYAEGPVPALASATATLLEDLVTTARWSADGTVSWGRAGTRTETRDVSLALLALLHGGYRGPLVGGACRRLCQLQDPRTGGWPECVVVWGTAETGIRTVWSTAALSTAFAVEALCRARLCERGSVGR
jgi:hypothetical protein